MGYRFHLLEKTHVNGPQTDPLIAALKKVTKSESRDVRSFALST